MNIAFSYVRFSSEKQSLGTSYARQVKLAEEYAAKHGLVLDSQKFDDLGVSAFKGANASEGALGRFLALVDSGHVPRGSTLLVESLDRISRASISEALPLFMSIVNRGITLVTLADSPPQVYTKEKIDADHGMSLFGSMMVLLRAHDESSRKSGLVKRAYDIKRAAGKVITSKGPAWLTYSADKNTWIIDKTKAKVVNRIYDMAIAGHGQVQIMRALEADKVPTMLGKAKVWSQSIVGAILRNPSVYGLFVQKSGGHQVQEDYYTPIMSKDKFMLAQSAVKGRLSKGGIRRNVTNLFSGLCFCKECGSRLRFVPTRKDNSYLHCLTAYSNREKCPGRPLPYKPTEAAFLQIIERDWDPRGKYTKIELLLQAADDLASRSVTLRIEQDRLKERQRALIKLAGLSPDIEVLAQELNSIQVQIGELEQQAKALDAPALSEGDVKAGQAAFERYHQLKDAGDEDGLNELRRSMKVMIARQIDSISLGYVRNRNIRVPGGRNPIDEPFMELTMKPPWSGPRGGVTRTFCYGNFVSNLGRSIRRSKASSS